MEFAKGSRSKILAILVLSVMAIFVIRLFYVQIIMHAHYAEQADGEYIKQFVLHAQRGEIYAMDGDNPTERPLVMNERVYTVWADPAAVKDKAKIIETLNKVAGGNVRKDFGKYLDVENSRYQVLATKVSRTQAEMIKKEKLFGIGFDAISQRVYPEGQLASQVLGFVNAEGDGKYGFEQFNDEMLKGKNGTLKTVTDVRDVPLTIGDKNVRQPAVDGKNVVLTIDRNVQAMVEKTLADVAAKKGAKNVSAIVMNPNNGQIIAMANMPTYDSSKINEVTDVAVFNNGVISYPYEVGSVAKTMTVAMGLDKGVITPQTTYVNNGYVKVYDATINNADKSRKLGTITMQDALDWSLNTGMVDITARLGGDGSISAKSRSVMYDYFHNKFKLGTTTGVELAGEAAGTVISPDEVQGNAVRYSNMSFGQGMDVTMVQTAAAFCSVVNGGTYYSPTVIGGYMEDDKFKRIQVKSATKNVINANASAQAREMIHNAHYATYKPSNEREGYYIGGKSGTSQTIDPTTGKYRNDNTIATYLGFGGNDPAKPAYVIMTTVQGDGNFGGGTDAKPIFNDISNWMLDYLKLQPKG